MYIYGDAAQPEVWFFKSTWLQKGNNPSWIITPYTMVCVPVQTRATMLVDYKTRKRRGLAWCDVR